MFVLLQCWRTASPALVSWSLISTFLLQVEFGWYILWFWIWFLQSPQVLLWICLLRTRMTLQFLSSGPSLRTLDHLVWMDTPLKSARMEVSPALHHILACARTGSHTRNIIIHHDKNVSWWIMLKASISTTDFSLFKKITVKHFTATLWKCI